MGKKKKEKQVPFSKMLREHQKDIKVMTSDGKKTLKEVTSETVSSYDACPLDSIVLVDVVTAAENADYKAKGLSVAVHYAINVYSMHEFAMKNPGIRQTLILTIPDDEYDEILDGSHASFSVLKDKSNLKLVLDNLPEKVEKRIKNWKESCTSPNMFVLRLRSLVMFTAEVISDGLSNVEFFDIIIELLHTNKSMEKLKKKNPDKFDEAVRYFVDANMMIFESLAVTSAHLNINPEFFKDPHDYADIWAEKILERYRQNKILAKIIFSTTNSSDLISFNKELTDKLVEETAIVM